MLSLNYMQITGPSSRHVGDGAQGVAPATMVARAVELVRTLALSRREGSIRPHWTKRRIAMQPAALGTFVFHLSVIVVYAYTRPDVKNETRGRAG